MSSILLDYHQGLGDQIICSGIVREYCKNYDRVGIFCLERNYPSVSFMYRDLTNLRIHVIRSHTQRYFARFLNIVRFGRNRYNEIRAIDSYDEESGILFERQVYKKFDIPLKKKWSSFFVKRDIKREEVLLKKANLSQPYQFVHDDARYPIDPLRLPSALPAFRPSIELTDNIFDYGTILEHADEIHVIDSSFMFLVDCLPYLNPTQKLFVHRYARTNPGWCLPLLKKRWIILS